MHRFLTTTLCQIGSILFPSWRRLCSRIRFALVTVNGFDLKSFFSVGVFGSFTFSPWRKNASYFGSGEAFLGNMRNDRMTECKSIIDQSEIKVYPWTGNNHFVQLCSNDHIAVGGGIFKSNDEAATESGFGMCIDIDDEVLQGTSQCCATFNNPLLSMEHQDCSPFEIVNLEVWTFTPTMTVQEANKIEFGRLRNGHTIGWRVRKLKSVI